MKLGHKTSDFSPRFIHHPSHIIHPTSALSPRFALCFSSNLGLISQQLAIEFGDRFEMM